jgi:hypothetical protein
MPTVKVTGPGHMTTVVFLNDSAVGRGGPNRREDVLLVQFFLNTLWGRNLLNASGAVIGAFGGSGAAPAIDGLCGPITIGAIETLEKSFGYSVDGRIDAVPAGHTAGARGGHTYLMLGLNGGYASSYGRDRHLMLFQDTKFPGVLRQALFV